MDEVAPPDRARCDKAVRRVKVSKCSSKSREARLKSSKVEQAGVVLDGAYASSVHYCPC